MAAASIEYNGVGLAGATKASPEPGRGASPEVAWLPRFGLRHQLIAAGVAIVAVIALAIAVPVFWIEKQKTTDSLLNKYGEVVQAASMRCAQALASGEQVQIDACLRELGELPDINLEQAYVIAADGRVAAHSLPAEKGKTYPFPVLSWSSDERSTVQWEREPAGGYSVTALLQHQEKLVGALHAQFSLHTLPYFGNELAVAVVVSVISMLVAGIGLHFYGLRLVARLGAIQQAMSRLAGGDARPLPVLGNDEITVLGRSFNTMMRDLLVDKHGGQRAVATMAAAYRDLEEQIERVNDIRERIGQENALLRELLDGATHDDLVGANGSLRHVVERARQLASLPVPVLIVGEPGSGKEMIARFLHNVGARNGSPFVAINCRGLPAHLLESELFGHDRGAFAGALGRRPGKLELAQGGTVFLDEVSALPGQVQQKLVHFLQQGEIQRAGTERPIRVDVRVIAATGCDLARKVELGHLRADLYYQLNAMQLDCPPLRARLEDIPVLVQRFLETHSKLHHKRVMAVSADAMDRLIAYSWPGNIRELKSVVERAVDLATKEVLVAEDFSGLNETASRPDSDRAGASEKLLRTQ